MSNQWSRTGSCQQKEWLLWWADTPQQKCVQLGARWVKGLCLEGPRGSDVQVVFWGDNTADAQGDDLSATRVRRVTCQHLITFSLRKSQLSAPLLACTCLVLCCLSPYFPSPFLPLVLQFTLPPLLLLLLHPLPEALSSELPRFFIKEISLEPSNYYGKRKKQRRKGTQGNVLFLFFLHVTSSVIQMCTYILHSFLLDDSDGLIFRSSVVCPSLPLSAVSLPLLG